MRKAGWWVLWVGVGLTSLFIVGGVVLAIIGFTHIGADSADDVMFDSQTTVQLKSGQRIAVYATSADSEDTSGSGDAPDTGASSGASARPVIRPADCTVTDPAGEQGTFSGGMSSTITRDGAQWRSTGSYAAKQDGSYRIACTDGQRHLLNSPLQVSGIFSGVGGVLTAVFGGLGGSIVIIVGLVLWIVGRGRERRPRMAPPRF